ncbi:MAG: cell division protein FtsA, partial [bacterium]
GMPELAEQILGLPVRRGIPSDVGGLVDMINSPKYATAVGLLKYGRDAGNKEKTDKHHYNDTHSFDSIFLRMKEWFKDFF